jgi:O-antigen/teichoic acid export membrane protein
MVVPSTPRDARPTTARAIGARWAAGVLARFAAGLAPTLLFGFIAHVGVAVVGLLAIPFYLRLMGEEAYGLVGFYFVLQVWMQLLDLGVSPALGRQLSRFRAGALPLQDAVSLLGAAEAFCLLAGLAAGTACFLSTDWLAHHWLGRSRLPTREIDLTLRLAGCLLVFRWLAGFYQTALVGLERQIAVNAVALIGGIARNACAVAGLILVSHSPTVFFAAWAGITFLEAVTNKLLLLRALPRTGVRWRRGTRLLTKEFGFAAGVTLSYAITTAVGQVDKLTLSHTLPLGDFGVFSLVISICAGISLIVPPTVQAFQPRLTTLSALGRRTEFVEVYRLSISLIIVMAAGLAGTIAAWPDLVVYAWTGSHEVATRLAPTLTLFALGSGIASFLYLPYVLQFAHGLIRLHVIGTLIFGTLWIPAAVWAAVTFGTVGAGAVWFLGNLLFLLLWVPVVHRRMLSPEERRGLSLQAFLRVALLAGLLTATHVIDTTRLHQFTALCTLAVISTAVMAVATLASRELRAYLSGMIGYTGVLSR